MINHLNSYLNDKLPEYLDLLRQMIEINSFTANADGVNMLGQLTAQAFYQLGFQAEFVQSVNPQFGKHLFLSSQRSEPADNQPTIALISHLDTVFSPEEEKANDFVWRVVGERVYGPGAVDIKGGTVLALMTLDAIQKFYPAAFEKTHWLVALDATEETISNDFGEHCNARLPADRTLACLIFEGGTPNPNGFPLVVARKGRAEFIVNVSGRGAHAGNYHRQGANAIVQLAHTIQQIANLTDYANNLTFNVGFIQGGSVANRVPHQAQAIVEMRAFDSQVFARGIESILSLGGESHISSQDGYPCQVSIATRSQTPPWPLNPFTDRLFEIWNAAASDLGLHLFPEQRGGLSDGNLLWQSYPTLDGLGPTGNNAHCSERSEDGSKDQEFVLLTSFVPKALLNVVAILRRIGEAIP
jgi:glutamate carboxypeptidase